MSHAASLGSRRQPCGQGAVVIRRTLNVVLEDLGEDGEERFLEAADRGRVGFAGDPDRQAQGLKQVVVKVRLAGILKTDTDKIMIKGHLFSSFLFFKSGHKNVN